MTEPPITLSRGYFTLREGGNKSITLPTSAFEWMFNNKNEILSDIKTGKGEEKLQWKNDEAKIFTKKADSLYGNRNSYKNQLWIEKDKTTMSFDKDDFVNMLLTLQLLMKLEQCPSFKTDHFYDLTSAKQIKLETTNNTFTIFDKNSKKSYTLPLAALEKSVQEKNKIYDDLESHCKNRKSYWDDHTDTSVYTSYMMSRNCRILCFGSSSYGGHASIQVNTFRKLVDLLGEFFGEKEPSEEDLMSEDEALSYGKKIQINSTKSIQFSKKREEFIITSKTERKREVKLPFEALDKLALEESKILADFASNVNETHGRDYFHEYWRNKIYAIRIAPSAPNDCSGKRSLRIDEIRNNDYMIVMKEKAFTSLLDIYKREKSE